MTDPRHLLSDDAMRDFILNGYIAVKTELPASVFEEAYRQTHETAQKGKVGGNIMAQAPALATVINSDPIRGALTSILGPTYYNLSGSYRHCHHMPPQPADATPGWHKMDNLLFHKDDNWPARHRCRRVMSIFFPHDCPPDRGPTALIPGSQYYTRTASAYAHQSIQSTATAGTVYFIHYDLWHGGTCNYTDQNRYMMKFTFVRMDEPTEPSWNCRDTAWKPVKRGPSEQQLNDLWENVWNWNCGKNGFEGAARLSGRRRKVEDIPRLIAALRDEDETVSLQSAYALARLGTPAVEPLLAKLVDEATVGPNENLNGRNYSKPCQPCQVYYAGYGLAAIGAAAVPGLTRLLRHEQWWLRAAAADTLREMGRPGAAAGEALAKALGDEHQTVRRYAAEALGSIGVASDTVVRALLAQLNDKTNEANLHAVTALACIRPLPPFAVPVLIKALEDDDVYVRGYAAVALERIGSNEARKAVAAFVAARPDEVCLTA